MMKRRELRRRSESNVTAEGKDGRRSSSSDIPLVSGQRLTKQCRLEQESPTLFCLVKVAL